MLELIPTLLAQQSKQAAPPVQPIETPVQSPAKASTPSPASPIATPEQGTQQAIEVSSPLITPTRRSAIPQTIPENSALIQGASPRVITSPVALPPVPVQKQIPFQSTETKTQPASETTEPKATQSAEQPTSNATLVTPQSSQENLERSATKPEATRSIPTAIEIPVPKPELQPTPKPTVISTQQQLLEQRLADIVAKDRAAKQAQQAQQQIQKQDALIARVYSYATQRRFEQARKLLQNPAISAGLRSQVLANINSLESASRAVNVTPTNQPVASKPVRSAQIIPAQKPIAVFTGVPSIAGRSQQTITIQVPPPINPRSIPSQSTALKNVAPTLTASDDSGGYIDQLGRSNQPIVVTPPDLQAYNGNLPKPTSRDQIVYPLPNPVSVTSRFGWRRHPVTGVRRFHAGVDLGAGQGTPVIAARGGRVTSADQMGGYGLAIVMQQPNGRQDTLYAHLSQILVRPGQTIQPGSVIGRVGSTGLSTGPHLHYEARQKTNSGWTAYDPGAQLEAARIRLVRARQLDARSASPTLQSALPSSNRGV